MAIRQKRSATNANRTHRNTQPQRSLHLRLWGEKIWVYAMIKIEDLENLPPEVVESLGEMV